MGVQEIDTLAQLSLPPGFRFYPTDEELLVQYLCRKVAGHEFALQIIAEIDLYKHDPWVLPSKAMFGEKEWYFFSPRDRKYPNGSRPNRVAGSGYWKATGTDKVINTEGRKVGIKKALVFYVGKAPKGTKTNWIMHEYRLIDSSHKNGSMKLDDWVLCRIYEKNSSAAQKPFCNFLKNEESNDFSAASSPPSRLDDLLDSLPEMEERFLDLPCTDTLNAMAVDGKINLSKLGSGNFDWTTLAGLSSAAPQLAPSWQQNQAQTQGSVGYASNVRNDFYWPSVYEAQSGLRTQRVDNSGWFVQNPGVLTQNISNSLDPYGFRCSTQ